ncbi:MAG: hypothetical protein FWD12_11975, partial [Alphaproteobacteria bacterium]|nr:hypothetical protein [Alphaproteobacteria bacterium]
LRIGQIRRANPALAAEIRAELDRGRPLSEAERAALIGALADRQTPDVTTRHHYVLATQSIGEFMSENAPRRG